MSLDVFWQLLGMTGMSVSSNRCVISFVGPRDQCRVSSWQLLGMTGMFHSSNRCVISTKTVSCLLKHSQGTLHPGTACVSAGQRIAPLPNKESVLVFWLNNGGLV